MGRVGTRLPLLRMVDVPACSSTLDDKLEIVSGPEEQAALVVPAPVRGTGEFVNV